MFTNKIFLFFLLFAISGMAAAQKYIYVNTDNLILRDRPEKEYNVFDVLHAPCRLEVIPYSKGYDNTAVEDKFYHVVLRVWFEKAKKSYNGYGWVEKKYVVDSRSKVTEPCKDSTETISYTKVDILTHDRKQLNYRSYPYPKYKGGEKNFETNSKRKYRKGPRGGCYYINAKGRKVYVDAKLCK